MPDTIAQWRIDNAAAITNQTDEEAITPDIDGELRDRLAALIDERWGKLGNSFGANAILGTNDNYPVYFRSNNVDRGALHTNGNWTHGTLIDDGSKMRVNGNIASDGSILVKSIGSNAFRAGDHTVFAAGYYAFEVKHRAGESHGIELVIRPDGNATNYNSGYWGYIGNDGAGVKVSGSSNGGLLLGTGYTAFNEIMRMKAAGGKEVLVNKSNYEGFTLDVAGTGRFISGVYIGSGGVFDRAGAGSPEGVITGPVGSTWRRTDGGAGTVLYVKESGASNTGWVAK